jgi:hypothetical protein
VHIDIKCIFGALANPLRRQTLATMGMLARIAAHRYGAQGMEWPGERASRLVLEALAQVVESTALEIRLPPSPSFPVYARTT